MDAKSARKRQELSILTSCSESIFVLASQMSIGKKPIELLPAPASEKGHILRCEWPQFQLSFKSVLLPMAELFQKFGVSRVGKFWSEPSPVFEVDFDSQASIQQIIDCLESGQLHRGMESIILPLTQMAWKDANPEVHPPEWKVDIDLELLQVLPNAQSKDAIIHQVNSTNVRACVRLWNERKVFDMGALLRWYRSKPRGLMEESPDIQLLDLVREMKEVVGWMQLGLQLGVPKHTLEVIRCQYATYGVEMCKTEMLSTWLDSHEEEPTWAEVVLAVSRTGNKKLARKIADKYGFALAALTESSTRDIKDSPVSMAVTDVLEPLRREMEETRMAVEDSDSELQLCARKKRKLEGDIAETRDNGDIVQKYTEMLMHDKRSLEQKLEEREKDLRSLQTQQLQYERTIRDLDVKLATAGTKAKHKLKDRLKLVKQEKEELVSRIEAQQKEKSKLLKRIDKLTLKLDRAKKDLFTVQSQLESKTSQLDEVQQQFQFIQDQRDDLRRQLEEREMIIEESIMQHVDSDSVSNKELRFQNWRSCRDMPFAMSSAQTVLLDGQVYIGSGYTYKDEFQYDILVYTPDKDEWSQLPPCPVKQFAMALVNHQLVLVGGRERSASNSNVTDKLTVWDGTSHQWTHPYPPIPTPLDGICAIGYQHYLVAAGGSQTLHLYQKSVLDNVEILDTMSSQWHTAQPLPIKCDSMRPAVLGNTLYLLDSSSSQFSFVITKMLAVSLPALISHATSHTPTAPMWESLPNIPLTGSTALAFQNSRLLALGGENERHECCSSVFLYNPVSKEWVKVGDMPFGKSSLGCAVLPSGELLVFGGNDEQFRHSKQVYKVIIT